MTKEPNKKKLNLSITNPTVFETIKIAISILIAFALTLVILCFISENPVNAFVTILTGPISKSRYMGVVISRTVPYAFAGLGCGLLFKSGAFNLGSEGIYVISAVAVAAVATTDLSALGLFHPYLCIIAGAAVGGVLMIIPSFLKAKFGTNEMVISLMLNSIYVAVATYIIRNFMLTTTTSTIGSKDYLPSAFLPTLNEKLKITPALFILVIATVVMYLLLKKTRLGYQIRVSGTNPHFAEYSGMSSFKLSITTALIAGAYCGIGSACQLLTQTAFFQPDKTTTGIGFSGLLLAMLGRNNPIGIVVAAFLIQYLEQGTNVLYFTDKGVPPEIVAIVEGVVILLISSQYFLRGFREKKLLKEGLENHAK